MMDFSDINGLFSNNKEMKALICTNEGLILFASGGLSDVYEEVELSGKTLRDIGLSFSTEKLKVTVNNRDFDYSTSSFGEYKMLYFEEVNSDVFKHINSVEENYREKLLERIINETSIVSITDTKGNIIEVNDTFVDITGYSKSELIGSNQNIVSSGYHGRIFWMSMWRTIGSGSMWKGEVLNKKKSGEYYWVDTLIAPFYNKEKIAGYVSVRREITERKKVEMELSQKALFFENATKLSRIGCWEIDSITGNPIWDETVKEIHEVDPDYKPSLETAINFYAPEARPIITELVQDGMQYGTGWDVELPLITAKGNEVWVRVIGTVEKEEDEVKRIFGVFQDITSTKQQRQMILEREGYDKETTLRKNFFSMMSHEIRKPLNVIVNLLSIIRENEKDAEQNKLLDLVQESSEDLLFVLKNILDLGALTSGRTKVSMKKFNISELIETVYIRFENKFGRKGLSFEINNELGEDFVFSSDKTRLIEVVSNVVDNALRYTDTGGATLGIKILRGELAIQIADTGIGIPEDQINKVFKGFEFVDHPEKDKNKGAGLGLSIADKLVTLMGGNIVVDSELGAGTTITIFLPIKEAEEVKTSTVFDDKEVKFKGTLLLVEDNVTNQKVLSLMLNKIGIKYHIANNGQEAIDMVNSMDIDFILMDQEMPVMKGNVATAKLREQGFDKSIVALTANVLDGFNYKAVGYDKYIMKPIKLEQLRELFL